MSISCPNCGVEIVGVVIGSSPFPGWGKPAQPPAQQDAQLAQNGSAGTVAHGSDLEPSTKKARAKNQGYDQGFLTFWAIYPRHRDKRRALSAWRRAIHRATAAQINAGAQRYRDDPNRLDEFTKYAEGWLNGDCWEDEPLPTRLAPGVTPSVRRQTPEEIAAELAAFERGAK